MSFSCRLAVLLVVLVAVVCPAVAHAQTAAQRGKLIVTVADPSGAIVSGATVTVVGLEAATKAATIAPMKTTDKGVATFDGLAPGRYSIQSEFPGFELGLLRDIRISRGDNKHVVILPLKGFSDEVTVGRDNQAAAADRSSTFGTALTREQVDSLSDDPTEMQQQLLEIMRVDSFEGQQLPPKSQIKSIHITRDQFAAENHRSEGLFIDIITQPGVGPLRANARIGFYDGSMDGRNPLIPKKGPTQNRNFGGTVSRSLLKNRSDFSLSFNGSSSFTTPNLYANTGTGTLSENLSLRTPNDNASVSGTFNYAITKDQTLRVGFGHNESTSDNQGVGAYDLIDRAYSTFNHNTSLRVQEAGPLGRRFFTNTRFTMNWSNSGSSSVTEQPTVIVNDAFTSGGAQRAGGRDTRTFSLMSDLDYVRGINSWRAGVSIEGGHYRSNDASNYLGTFTFDSLDTFAAGQPRSYTRRIGDPLIAYWNLQAGAYIQDDVRISKSLTLSPGVRFEEQTHVSDHNNIAPRFGMTWAPFKSGKTTLRGSWGIFYDWLSTGTYEQTLRVDGFRQQEIDIINPSYPDPGTVGTTTATNRYLLADNLPMIRNNRLSAGIQQTITKFFSAGASYVDARGIGLLVGQNLNAPVNGVRPNPAFANLIKAVADGRSTLHSLSVNAQLFVPSTPQSNAPGAPRFMWKRGLGFYTGYGVGASRNNTDGAFSVPASADLSSEWGPSAGDYHQRLSLSVNTGALKNFNASVSMYATTGMPIDIRTGHDDNGDLIFNDRPAGVGRNSARAAGQWNMSGFFSYTLGLGRQQVSGPGGVMITMNGGAISATTMAPQAAPRYRLSFQVSVNNLTNHANYTGYSGIMTSPFFLQPTSVQGVRRVTFSMNVGF